MTYELKGRLMTESKQYMTVQEVKDYIRVSAGHLHRMTMLGVGPACSKVGRRLIFDKADVDAWMDAHKDKSTQQATASALHRSDIKRATTKSPDDYLGGPEPTELPKQSETDGTGRCAWEDM